MITGKLELPASEALKKFGSSPIHLTPYFNIGKIGHEPNKQEFQIGMTIEGSVVIHYRKRTVIFDSNPMIREAVELIDKDIERREREDGKAQDSPASS